MSLTKEEISEINQARTEQVKSYPIGSEVYWFSGRGITSSIYNKGIVAKHNRYTLGVETCNKIKNLNLYQTQVFRK